MNANEAYELSLNSIKGTLSNILSNIEIKAKEGHFKTYIDANRFEKDQYNAIVYELNQLGFSTYFAYQKEPYNCNLIISWLKSDKYPDYQYTEYTDKELYHTSSLNYETNQY